MPVLEVRCCCDPDRLLGYLDVPERLAYDGARFRCPFLDGFDEEGRMAFGQFELEVGTVGPPKNGAPYLAVKSNETPIKLLRGLRGFREAR